MRKTTFRWKPTTIILLVIFAGYLVVAGIGFTLGTLAWIRSSDPTYAPLPSYQRELLHSSGVVFRFALWDLARSALCLAAWILLKRATRVTLLLGAFAIAAAIVLVAIAAASWILQNALVKVLPELLLVLPGLAYAFGYAANECSLKSRG